MKFKILLQEKMFALSIVTFVIIISIVAKAQVLEELEYQELISLLKEAAEEYVRLHLVEELSKADELVNTFKGRQWLRAWINRRNFIFSKIVFENKHKWLANWEERLRIFQELQNNYFQSTIVVNYDKRRSTSPWPKITFDVFKPMTIVHPEQRRQPRPDERDFSDPFATDEDIDNVFRLHRPFTNDEIKTNAAERRAKKNPEPFLKEYHFLNMEQIQKLQTIYYELIRQSLKGKRMSDLDYRAALLHADRIVDNFFLLLKHNIHYKSDTKDNFLYKRLSSDMKILERDDVYRKYLNYDVSFYTGNVLYGPINRHDDPKKFNLNFEENAIVLLGKRYQFIHHLARDINQFEIKSRGFTKIDPNDLMFVNSFLQRFKIYTFDFTESNFKMNQWSFDKKLNTNYDLSLIKPKNYRFRDWNEMFEKVSKIFIDAVNSRKYDTFDDFILFKSELFKNELQRDVYELSGKKILSFVFVHHRVNNVISYLNCQNYVNLLTKITNYPINNDQFKLKLQSPQQLFKVKNDDTQVELLNNNINDKQDTEMLNKLLKLYEIPIGSSEDRSILDMYLNPLPGTSNLYENNQYFGNGDDGDYFNRKRSYSSNIGDVDGTSHKRHATSFHRF